MNDDTPTTTPEGRSFERLVGRLDASKLHEVFSNVQAVPDDRFSVYRVLDKYGSEAGMLTHLGGHEWRAYVDNFPGQKKFFSWNLPTLTLAEFEADVKRTGLHLLSSNTEAQRAAVGGPTGAASWQAHGETHGNTKTETD